MVVRVALARALVVLLSAGEWIQRLHQLPTTAAATAPTTQGELGSENRREGGREAGRKKGGRESRV